LAPELLALTAGFSPLGAPGNPILALPLIGGATAWVGNMPTLAAGTFKLYRQHQNPLHTASYSPQTPPCLSSTPPACLRRH